MCRIIIEELNINGEGISYKDNNKFCVKNVLINEEVEVENFKVKQNFFQSKLKKILKPSQDRIKEKCKFCTICGGCDFMFVRYKKSLMIKKDVLKKYFEKFFCGEIKINYSDNEFYYRNKVAFKVENNKIGLQKYMSNKLIEIDECIVAKQEINQVLNVLREYLKQYNNVEINHAVIRCLNGHMSIAIVCSKKPRFLNILVEKLKNKFNDKFGLYVNYNTNNKKIFSDKWEYVYGQKELQSTLFGIDFYVKPYSFMQINENVMEKMYKRVLGEIENEIVIEGYSGIGLLSCILSKKAKKVYSIELNNSASQDAEKTKKLNKIVNLENINGDCNIFLPKLIQKHKDATFIIDPPRSGLGIEILQSILKSRPKKIIYISCNPYTLKQNIVFLKDSYYIDKFEIFDIFPQTFEIESFVVLKIK